MAERRGKTGRKGGRRSDVVPVLVVLALAVGAYLLYRQQQQNAQTQQAANATSWPIATLPDTGYGGGGGGAQAGFSGSPGNDPSANGTVLTVTGGAPNAGQQTPIDHRVDDKTPVDKLPNFHTGGGLSK